MNFLLHIGTIAGLLGALFVALKKYMEGQVVWLFANAFLFLYNFFVGNYWMMLLFGTYEALTIYAIINLRRTTHEGHVDVDSWRTDTDDW